MATINGTDITVVLNDITIGHSIALVFDLGQDLPDASSRDSDGWKEHIQGMRNASLSIGGLTDYNDSMNYNEFAAFVITREIVTFSFTTIGGIFYGGEATVESVEQLANFEDVASYNLELKVTGAAKLSDGSRLLLETGDFFLLETGFNLLLE